MKQSTKAKLRGFYVKVMDILRSTPFAKTHLEPGEKKSYSHALELTQPFKPSATLESKKHNLREAASRINTVVVRPGEIFSFWHIVGNPNNRKRFQEGRSIHAGVLSIDVGGGLCQASGIIHHLALQAGLDVVERFNHSVDLYNDETRFAPLGTDATVFYGFKDLRLRNTLRSPIVFQLMVEENLIRAQLRTTRPILPKKLDYNIEVDEEGNKHVEVLDEDRTVISTSHYKSLETPCNS